MTTVASDEVRWRLASMQQAEKEELQAHLHQVETTLSSILAGQRDPFDCVRSIAGIEQALDADAARTVMRDYNEEASRIAAARTREKNILSGMRRQGRLNSRAWRVARPALGCNAHHAELEGRRGARMHCVGTEKPPPSLSLPLSHQKPIDENITFSARARVSRHGR